MEKMKAARLKAGVVAVLMLCTLAMAALATLVFVTRAQAESLAVPGEFYGSFEPFEYGGATYTNYNHGYTKTVDGEIVEVVGMKNVSDTTGEAVFVAVDYTTPSSFNVNRIGSLVYYAIGVEDDSDNIAGTANNGKTGAEILATFRAKYKEMIESDYNPGIPTRGIQVWNGAIMQSFGWGDGTHTDQYAADAPRCIMLSYNPVVDTVYILDETYACWLSVGSPFCGYPYSGLLYDAAVKINGAETRFAYVQKFANGYMASENGTDFAFTAMAYDAENDNYGESETINPPEAYANYYGNQLRPYIEIDGATYVNYDYGYIKCVGSQGNYTYEYFYGRNIGEDGNITYKPAETLANLQRSDSASGVSDIAGENAQTAFFAAYSEAMEACQVPGLSATEYYVFNGMAIQNYWHGDYNGNREGYIVYNPAQEKAHFIGYFAEAWLSMASDLRSPIGIFGSHTFSVNGVSVTLDNSQMFQGGYIYREDGAAVIVVSEYNAETGNYGESYTINPTNAWAEFYGSQLRPYVEIDGVTYVNYERGYVKCTVSDGDYVYEYFYGRNIGGDGTVTYIDAESAASVQRTFYENTGTVDYEPLVRAIVGEGVDVAAVYKAAYIASFNEQNVPGVSWNGYNVFNGMVIQNYWHGDYNGFREGYIVYNPAQKEAHFIGYFAEAWLSMASNLRSPLGRYGEHTFSVNGEEATYRKSQLFEGGFIYEQNGKLVIVLAFFDQDRQNYIDISVPGDFGAYVNMIENGDETYYNFERGAVLCVAVNGNETYTLFPARNFTGDGKAELISIDYYMSLFDDVSVVGSYSDERKAEILENLKAAYRALYESGFFPGTPDHDVQIWDGIFGLQCFVGDSTANPFNAYDARTNVMTFAYNVNTDEIIVLKDEMLLLWSKLRIAPVWAVELDAPTSEAQYDGDNVYQQFGKYLLVCIDGNIETWVVTEQTYEEWKAAQQALTQTSAEDGKGGCGSAIGAASAFGAAVLIVGAALAVSRKKKIEK